MHPCPRCQQTQAAILSYSAGHICAHKHTNTCLIHLCWLAYPSLHFPVPSPLSQMASGPSQYVNSKFGLANLLTFLFCSSLSFSFVFLVVLGKKCQLQSSPLEPQSLAKTSLTLRRWKELLVTIQESWGRVQLLLHSLAPGEMKERKEKHVRWYAVNPIFSANHQAGITGVVH